MGARRGCRGCGWSALIVICGSHAGIGLRLGEVGGACASLASRAPCEDVVGAKAGSSLSWRSSASDGAQHVGGEFSAVGRKVVLDKLPVAEFAVRAAGDLEGGHATHEGLRPRRACGLAAGMASSPPRQRQAFGLGRRG